MNEEYLSKCVVDILKRKIYLHSQEGTEKEVSCDSVEEFMNALKFVRSQLDESMITYSNLL